MHAFGEPRNSREARSRWWIMACLFLPLALGSCGGGDADSAGGLDQEAASEIVLKDVVQVDGLARPIIVFAWPHALQPGDVVSPYQPEGYPAVEPTTLTESTWFFWVDDAPGALYVHPTRFVFVSQSNGEVTVQDQDWWPLLNGEGLWVEDDEYWDPDNWAYSRVNPPADSGARLTHSSGLAARVGSTALQEEGRRVGIVLNGYRDGERLKEMFEIDSNGVHDALTESGFDMAYYGPASDSNPDRDGDFDPEVYTQWFIEQRDELKEGDTLFVFLTGHGFVGHRNNGFAGPMGEDALIGFLKWFKPGVTIIVVVQACESGSFIDGLQTVADVTVTSTDMLSPAYNDIDTGTVQDVDEEDVNDDDVGSEFMSGFIEGWRAIRASQESQAEVQRRAEGPGRTVWTETAALSFVNAIEKDVAAKAGMEFPQMVRGDKTAQAAAAARPTATVAMPTVEPSDGSAQQVFVEPENNVLFCNSGDPVQDPAAYVQRIEMNFNPDGTVVFVYPGVSPQITFSQDYSYSVQARLGHSGGGGYDVGMYEVHAGQTKTGMLASAAGDITPGTEGTVTLTDRSVVFVFDGYEWTEEDTITVRTFHLPTDSDQVRCGQTQAWPVTDPGPQ